MCLAIPMRVTSVQGDPDDFTSNQIATVDTDGISKEVRLDIVDHWPAVGDYVIIHAGFAIQTGVHGYRRRCGDGKGSGPVLGAEYAMVDGA